MIIPIPFLLSLTIPSCRGRLQDKNLKNNYLFILISHFFLMCELAVQLSIHTSAAFLTLLHEMKLSRQILGHNFIVTLKPSPLSHSMC